MPTTRTDRPSRLIPRGLTDPNLTLDIIDARLRELRDAAVALTGTLAPDTKPDQLTRADAGLLFHALDVDRVFRWSGTAWQDAPAQPARGQIGYFLGTAPVGWAPCAGGNVQRSTAAGELEAVAVPSLPPTAEGLRPYYRL